MKVVPMTANNTIMFKDAVGSYEDFVSSPIAEETIDEMTVYGYDKELKKQVEFPRDVWCKEIYRILVRHYRVSEIGFENVDSFLDVLWERIEVHAPNYIQRKTQYNRLLQLDDKELVDNGLSIRNITENTNDRSDDVFAALKNITNQEAAKLQSSLASGIRNQIYNSRMDLLHDFLRKFDGLFIHLTSKSNYSNGVRVPEWLGYTE